MNKDLDMWGSSFYQFSSKMIGTMKELAERRFKTEAKGFKDAHVDVYGVYRNYNKRGYRTTTVKLKNGSVGTVTRFHRDKPNDTVAIYEAYIKALKLDSKRSRKRYWLTTPTYDKNSIIDAMLRTEA